MSHFSLHLQKLLLMQSILLSDCFFFIGASVVDRAEMRCSCGLWCALFSYVWVASSLLANLGDNIVWCDSLETWTRQRWWLRSLLSCFVCDSFHSEQVWLVVIKLFCVNTCVEIGAVWRVCASIDILLVLTRVWDYLFRLVFSRLSSRCFVLATVDFIEG